MQITKSLIRKTILQYRKLMDESTYQSKNCALLGKIKELLTSSEYKTVHVFFPIHKNREPDITPLLHWMWEREMIIISSKTDFKNHQMEHFYITPETKLITNNYGIAEPIDAKPAKVEEIDLVFVPGVIGDKQGNRIGYGGGYYDQFLEETNAKKVLLLLSPPLNKINQVDKWDVKMDEVFYLMK